MLKALISWTKNAYRTLAAVVMLAIIFWISIDYNYLLFHTLVELFSIIVAFAVFTVTWNSRKMLESNYLYFQGITYLFIGGLDLMHTLTFKGMNIFPAEGLYYSNQFWVATRFIEAAALMGGFSFMFSKRRVYADLTFLGYVLLTGLIILSVLVWKNFPTCFIDGVGQTPFKIYAEYTIIAVLGVGVLMLLKFKDKFEPSIFRYLLAAVCSAIISEFCFTLYVSNYSASNAVGHCAKLITFFFTYKAVVEKGFVTPATLIFKNLSDSERNYRTLSENLPVLIFRFDHKGHCIYANRAVQLLIGSAAADYREKPVEELGLPEGFAKCIGQVLGAARESKQEQEVDFSFSASKHYALKIIPEYTSGLRDFTYLLISYDITQLKMSERALQDLNATKDKFFSIIGHDLKTPFTSILAFSEMIAKNTQKFTPSKLEQMALSIRKAAQTAYALLENLLSWSRLQTGALVPKPEHLDVRELIAENVDLFTPLAGLKGITIRRSEESFGSIYADKQMSNTILRNLTTNAIKYSHPDSEVYIKAVPKESEIIFTVQDCGTGIPQHLVERLFKMESSFTTIGTGNEKGSGLGLILSKEFVEKSNGRIWLESTVGVGTTFYFSMPISPVPSEN